MKTTSKVGKRSNCCVKSVYFSDSFTLSMAYAARQHLRLMTCLLTIPFTHLETDGNVLFSKILHHKHICGNLCKISHFCIRPCISLWRVIKMTRKQSKSFLPISIDRAETGHAWAKAQNSKHPSSLQQIPKFGNS